MLIVVTFLMLVVAAILGWVSYKNTKTFVAGLFAVIPVAGGLLLLLRKFTGLMVTADVGNGGLFSMLGAMFSRLPEIIQNGVILFPVIFFGMRVAAWVYYKYIFTPVVEDKAGRRKRILAEYGMSP